jgi:hypothetical protein
MQTIITNHHWRPFLYRYEVPQDVLDTEFDWLDEMECDGFFRYRGVWYHLSEFMGFTDPHNEGWQGYYAGTVFSAVLINVSEDCEEYQVALALA